MGRCGRDLGEDRDWGCWFAGTQWVDLNLKSDEWAAKGVGGATMSPSNVGMLHFTWNFSQCRSTPNLLMQQSLLKESCKNSWSSWSAKHIAYFFSWSVMMALILTCLCIKQIYFLERKLLSGVQLWACLLWPGLHVCAVISALQHLHFSILQSGHNHPESLLGSSKSSLNGV